MRRGRLPAADVEAHGASQRLKPGMHLGADGTRQAPRRGGLRPEVLPRMELGERFSGTELVAGTASFATMWGLGALLGALLAGWAFEGFGPDGLPYTLAALFAIFIVAMSARRIIGRA